MDCGRGHSHCATNVRDLNPGAVEIGWSLEFRHHPAGALLHHLLNEFVSIEQLTADGGEQTSRLGLARIVSNVGDRCVSIS